MLTRRIRAIFHQSVRENDNFHLKPLTNLESLKEELFDLESEMETFIK